MDKIYEIESCKVKVCLEEGLIRVYSDRELWKYLDLNVRNKLSVLVDLVKSDYKHQFNADLKINRRSLMVEIWVHICSDYYGLLMLRIVKFKLLTKLLMKGIKRAEIIDCGVTKKDSNRWVWDLLAYIEPIIFWFGPNNLTRKQLK